MSLEKRGEKKAGKTIVGRKPKLASVGGRAPWDLVADIAESSTSLSEVADKAKEEFGLEKLTIPTVSAYLKKAWGDDYQRKKEDMSERRSNRRKWKQEFELSRQGIGEVFKKEYLSPNDGIYFNQESGEIETLPFIIELGRYWREIESIDPDTGETVKKRQALPKKNVVNFSKAGDFGWSEDQADPDALGTSEPTTQGMVLRQLIRRVEGLIDEKKKRYVKAAVDLELSRLDLTQITVEEIPKLHRDTTRRIRRESADELRTMDEEKVRMIGTLLNQLSRGDNRSKFTHGRDLFDEKIGPAYASSDKKWRGKQRMLTLSDETFSRAVQNLPFVLYCHPKRLQVHCNSSDTEILTENGWKFFYELENDDCVATISDKDELEYQKPLEIIEADYEGPMVRFKKANIDLLVTPNHNMWVARRGGNKENYHYNWVFKTAEKIFNTSTKRYPWIIKRDVVYNLGKSQEFHSLPDGDYHTGVVGVDIPTKLWLVFTGLMIGDGYLGINKRNYNLILAADVKDKFRDFKIDVCKQICDILGQSMYVNDSVIEMSSKRLYEKLLPIGKSDKKTIPREYLELDKELLFYLYDGLIKSDGHYTEYTTHRYSTISPSLRDTFQELCLKLGYVATYNIRPESEMVDPRTKKVYIRKMSYNFSIATSRSNIQIFTDDVSMVDYSGKIYCVTVPNHRIFVRRNGKVCWTGNSHNLSKKLPELLNPEKPVVKARFNDIEGVNARVRFPRNQKEYIETMEAGMIVTEDFANRFKYFTVVEEGTLIAENIGSMPEAPRRHDKIRIYKDYEHFKDRVKSTSHLDRLDPITAGGFEELGHSVGNRSARHSGELVLVGKPKRKTRKITLSQGAEGDDVIAVEYWAQDYQIVRQDVLRVGDKLLDRAGLKGIISDIVPKMGKDAKGRPYDLIANYDEVWREADRSTAKGRIDDDTYYKQGKKKSAIILEHEAGDGQIFFFMIDKFAQDSTTTGLSFSPTLVSGLWERALDQLPANATEKQRDDMVEHFAERYFRGEGNFVSTLKSLHYKAVKKDGVVSIMVDNAEPTPDLNGEVVELPHTYAGNTYRYAYIPHYISRVYFDGKTFREIYIEQEGTTPNDASDFYWFNVMKQAKNRFRLFPRQDGGIQLVTRPWAEDPKDATKYHKVQMDYFDLIDLGVDPYDKNIVVTFRKEPVTSGDSIQTHPVDVDFSGKYRGTVGMNPQIALKATIDYDGDTVAVFIPAITDAVSYFDKDDDAAVAAVKKMKFDEKFVDLYDKAKKYKYGKDEAELGLKSARYNQETAETENELIERLGGLRKRSLILQGKMEPVTVTIGVGSGLEEDHVLDMETINRVTDVEKILKMREPRWLLKRLQKRPWGELTDEERDIVRDYHIRKQLRKVVDNAVRDPGVRKLYDLLKQPSEYMKEEFMSKAGDSDPIGMKLDTRDRLLDRILYNEIRESDIFTDLDE